MSKSFKLGDLKIDAQAYGSQGNAVLGIRDSGKTYTATEIAEKLFEAGIPFITFDPTGVWRFLRVPGAGRGYPVVVAGGKSGDLPLTVTGAVEIVRAAMANGVSLVLDLTDPLLSKADWKRIVKSCVRVLLQENEPHGLRHIFIEEAAEFVPQRVGKDNGDVYAEMEKLARIGGNARLGYTLVNQRSQEVNKAVLELCENLFLHRQRGKNALQSLDHWFGVASVDPKEIMRSLPRLPSGQCWAWMGDQEAPLLIQVPPKNSFHPNRRTMRGAKGALPKQAVRVGEFVKGMLAALPAIEAQQKANDPKLLQAELARVKAELHQLRVEFARKPLSVTRTLTDPAAMEAAQKRGFEQAKKKLSDAASREASGTVIEKLSSLQPLIGALMTHVDAAIKEARKTRPDIAHYAHYVAIPPVAAASVPRAVSTGSPQTPSRANPATPIAFSDAQERPLGGERKPLAVLASVYPTGMTEAQWAVAAGLKRRGGTWGTYVSRLRTANRISRRGDLFFITEQGLADLGTEVAALPPPGPELVAFWADKISGAGPMLRKLAEFYPGHVSRERLAEELNLSAGAGTFGTYLSRLRAPGLIEVTKDGVRAAPEIMGA